MVNIIPVASGMLQDFLNTQEFKPVAAKTSINHHWCPSIQFQYKANFGDAVFQSNNSVGLGVVIRDHRGDIVGALFMRIPPPSNGG